ncbi:AAA family ATPase [Caballeronia sp. LZ029]|uniref:AAA family ATPase n=1 Tax=Caballeronia sp. LZ029 TaxID=3038564 RepID=UPI00285E5919|nr:AAA family ATPase [Caballeronia sp. LZ029]MDR5746762.1 AAA family ATPase [Caballeronia sp. LZ029]
MSHIRVDKIHIENFKRIKSQEIELKPLTALVGGNTSGKSSILQGAQLCVSMMQACFKGEKRGGRIEHLGTLSNEAVSYRPTEMLLSLRHGGPANQTKSFGMGYTCTRIEDDGTSSTSKLSVQVTRGKNANLALTFDGDKQLIAPLGDRDRPFCIFAPGLSGIPLREEWRTRGALDASAMHGDANLYLRSLLDHLLRKGMDEATVVAWCHGMKEIDQLPQDAPWRVFSSLLDECYPGARIYISHDSNRDRYVNVFLEYLDQRCPIDMASTGMLQVIQILAYACFYSPPLLLLDEPDAHLHADSQVRLHQALRNLTRETNTRIVLATHSPQLIQLLLDDSEASVLWLDKGSIVQVDPGGRPAIPLLMELGALTVGAEAFKAANKIILLTEDNDTECVKVFAKANGAEDFACFSYNGCANLPSARQLALLLCELRPDVKIIIHRDRDFRTVEEMAFEAGLFENWRKSEGDPRIEEVFTPENDIEHSFIQPGHLLEALAGAVSPPMVELMLAEAIALKRDDIIHSVRKAREVIERDIYDAERMKKKVALRQASALPQKAPNVKCFLPEDGKTPLTLAQCHGKTAYQSLLPVIHRFLKGDSKRIKGLVVRESHHLVDSNWQEALGVEPHAEAQAEVAEEVPQIP